MDEARLFQALSDATRLKILSLLAREPMNVSRIVSRVGCAQPAVSRHLRVLREVALIRDTRKGKEVEYSLNPGQVRDATAYLDNLLGVAGSRQARAERPEAPKPERGRRQGMGAGIGAGAGAGRRARGRRRPQPSREAREAQWEDQWYPGAKKPRPHKPQPQEPGPSDMPEFVIERKKEEKIDEVLL